MSLFCFLVQQGWNLLLEVDAFDCHDRQHRFRYKYLDIVGNGTFGIVCRAKDQDTGETIAIKTVYQDEGHQVGILLISFINCMIFVE